MTRRTINLRYNSETNPLDKGISKEVRLLRGDGLARQGETALSGSEDRIIINDDIWNEEFIAVGSYLYRLNEEADIYDVFMWIREELHGGQPLGEGLVSRVDAEIAKELGPWT